MKRILFVGLIALVMLLAVPMAMAAETEVTIGGKLEPSLSISLVDTPVGGCIWSDVSHNLVTGENTCEYGKLRVTADRIAWKVRTTTSPVDDGWMYDGSLYLFAALKQWTPDKADWINVRSYTDTGGSIRTPLTNTDRDLKYYQVVAADDPAGTYGIKITYTVGAP